ISLADGQLFHTGEGLRFLPDGKGVIMIATAAGKAPRTYIQMLDGSAPRSFGLEGFRGTAVSPDGKFVVGRKGNTFWMVPFAGDETTQGLALGNGRRVMISCKRNIQIVRWRLNVL